MPVYRDHEYSSFVDHLPRGYRYPQYYNGAGYRDDDYEGRYSEEYYSRRPLVENYRILDQWEEQEPGPSRPWLPRNRGYREDYEPRRDREPEPSSGGRDDPDKTASEQSPPADESNSASFLVNADICQEISSLLTEGISTEQSKQATKEFPLSFAEPEFSIKPPKLDNWMVKRARDKGTFRAVNASEEVMAKIQLKIMDIGQPLISTYAQLKDPNSQLSIADVPKGLQIALQQWGRAFAYLSKVGRDAIVRLTEPRYSYLLKEKEALPVGKEAREHLFTTKFIDIALREATQEDP